jgi:hypothetical protein
MWWVRLVDQMPAALPTQVLLAGMRSHMSLHHLHRCRQCVTLGSPVFWTAPWHTTLRLQSMGHSTTCESSTWFCFCWCISPSVAIKVSQSQCSASLFQPIAPSLYLQGSRAVASWGRDHQQGRHLGSRSDHTPSCNWMAAIPWAVNTTDLWPGQGLEMRQQHSSSLVLMMAEARLLQVLRYTSCVY